MQSDYLLFNFNSLSHLTLGLSLVYINIFHDAIMVAYGLGHLAISVAQYFVKYNDMNYKYISSVFGSTGHSLLFLYVLFTIIIKNKKNKLHLMYLFCQPLMILFYLNHAVGSLNTFKIILFSLVFICLSFYYFKMYFTVDNISKYGMFLVGLVYIDLILFININKSE